MAPYFGVHFHNVSLHRSGSDHSTRHTERHATDAGRHSARRGNPTPAFAVLANDLSPVTEAALQGKVTVLIPVPCLDTPVCDTEVRRFNQEAAARGAQVQIFCVSADLPFAQARWCGAASVRAVRTLSAHCELSLGKAFGVAIKELRLLARAVFVTDAAGVLRYEQLVSELTDEPAYSAALAAVKQLL